MAITKSEAAKKADAYYANLSNPRGTETAVANVVGEIGRILKDARNLGDTPAIDAEMLARLAEVSKWVGSDVRKAVRKLG